MWTSDNRGRRVIQAMAHYLLIGAGFTRNWGGPLSDEVTGSLLSELHDDPVLAKALRSGRSLSITVIPGSKKPAAKRDDAPSDLSPSKGSVRQQY
jgi:hypothetical protein